jgi:hypothetical protein
MATRPDFTAIAAHRQQIRRFGDSVTDRFLDQVVAYALALEQERADWMARARNAPRDAEVTSSWEVPPRP